MHPDPRRQTRPRAPGKQRGLGLIDALVALVVFSLGMMALAELYVRAAPATYQNTRTTAVQMTADGLFGVLQANPSVLPIQVTNATSASATDRKSVV